jgi:hypothetical protein
MRTRDGIQGQNYAALVARSRADIWMRDELILAMDLYRREGTRASRASRQALSDLLRTIPVERHLADDPTFRSRAAVSYKLGNLDSANPSTARRDSTITRTSTWRSSQNSSTILCGLAATVEAIRANLDALSSKEAEVEEPDVVEALEGRVLTRVHRARERNTRLVETRKRMALAEHGRLARYAPSLCSYVRRPRRRLHRAPPHEAASRFASRTAHECPRPGAALPLMPTSAVRQELEVDM